MYDFTASLQFLEHLYHRSIKNGKKVSYRKYNIAEPMEGFLFVKAQTICLSRAYGV